MLIGSAGGMLVSEASQLPYDAQVEYLTPIIGEPAYFDTRITSLTGDINIYVAYYFEYDASGHLLGANGITNKQLNIEFSGNNTICHMGGDTVSLDTAAFTSVSVSLNLAAGRITYGGTSYQADPSMIATPLYIFASSDVNGVVSGSVATGMRLYHLETAVSSRYTHKFIPVRVTDATTGNTTGALYDMWNTSGGPLGNGLYLPVGGRIGVGPDVSGS